MESLWYLLVSLFLITFATLDGFDIGVGSLYLLLARNETEKAQARLAIAPIWGGNEVWLIAGAGTLFFAFPGAYASIFSRFYLGLFLILWALIMRGLSLELRAQLDNPLWHTFWDTLFGVFSIALAGLWGIVVGNWLRGVPLTNAGDPNVPLWTNFRPGPQPGMIDWYTLLIAGYALLSLIIQGANYLAYKTDGNLHQRATQLALKRSWMLIPSLVVVVTASLLVQPQLLDNFSTGFMGIVLIVLVVGAMAALQVFARRKQSGRAFLASSLLTVFLLATGGYATYPNFLYDSTGKNTLTVFNAVTHPDNLRLGLVWFAIGFSLIVVYVTFMYRSFWGKVSTVDHPTEY